MKSIILSALSVITAFAASDWNDGMRRANNLQQERRYEEAGKAYRAALAAASQFGERDWRYGQASNNYAAHLFERGDYSRAAEQYRHAITAFEAAGQAVNAGVATCNLAVLYRATGRYSEAVIHATEALRIYSEAFPGGSMNHVVCRTNLAEALNSLGRAASAETQARTAVAAAERIVGSDDARLGSALHVLGNILHSNGRPEEAIGYLERALAIRRRTLDDDHPFVAATLSTLAAAHFRTGDLAAADAMAHESVCLFEASGSTEDARFVGALNNLAQIRAAIEPASAEPLFRRALAIAESRLGARHPDTAKVQSNFAAWFASVGRLRAAESMYRQAEATLLATVGTAHPLCRITREGLADVYARMGRITEARSVRQGTRSFLPEQ